MKKTLPFLLLSLFLTGTVYSQTKIDSSFAFQTDPDKKFALYIPSTYSPDTASSVILALHPWHDIWGNSTTWRDILSNFAEENNLILVAPDGGADGQIDNPIDRDFMIAILDSVENWYSVNTDKEFMLGFSWGARAVYSHGLKTHERFAGFMTIGAFFNGTGGLPDSLLDNALNEPFYIMHGDQDFTAQIDNAFFPIRDELIERGAIVESLILKNVGHTINFTNRDEILTTAYQWLDSVSTTLAVNLEDDADLIPETTVLSQNYPNPFNPATTIQYSLSKASNVKLEVFTMLGQSVGIIENSSKPAGNHSIVFDAKNLPSGIYIYKIEAEGFTESKRMMLIK